MKFTLNKKSIEVTDSWDTMTFAQYLRILKLKDDTIELVSILTGIDYDYLKRNDIKGVDKILYAAQFVKTPPQFKEDELTQIGEWKLPLNSKGFFDIQFESLAQFEDMRMVITTKQDGVQAHTEAYAKYCALYVQKLRDGQYDGDKAMAMVPEIMQLPAGQIITAGSFFFVKLMSFLNGTGTNSQNIAHPQKKSTGNRSKKSSGRTPRLTKSRGR